MGATPSSDEWCRQKVEFSRDPTKKYIDEGEIVQRIQQTTKKQKKQKIMRGTDQNSLSQLNSNFQLYSMLGKELLEKSNLNNQHFKEEREFNLKDSQPHKPKLISKKDKSIPSLSNMNQSKNESNSIQLVNSKLMQSERGSSFRINCLSDSLPKIGHCRLNSISLECPRSKVQSGRLDGRNTLRFTNKNFMQSIVSSHRTRSRHKSIFSPLKTKNLKIQQKSSIDIKSQRQTIELQNGDVFQGEIDQEGEFEGEGIYTLSNGSVYKGIFRKGKASGVGMYYGVDGFKFEGQWVDNAPHGYGKAEYNDGSTYAGYFKRGKRHGKGYFSKGKITYNGEFFQDKMQGYGVYLSQKGQIYEGEWLNNLKHGKGLFKMSNGEVYQGQFKNDMKQGYGKMSYANDSYYVGFWTNDKIDKRRRQNRTQSGINIQNIGAGTKKCL